MPFVAVSCLRLRRFPGGGAWLVRGGRGGGGGAYCRHQRALVCTICGSDPFSS